MLFFVSADETAYLDAGAEDYLALAAYDLASTDAEKSEFRKEWNGARHV